MCTDIHLDSSDKEMQAFEEMQATFGQTFSPFPDDADDLEDDN